jgi:hypothetical protein
MSTIAELDAQIAETEASISRTLKAIDMGKGDRRERRESLAELRTHLQYLHGRRAQMQRKGGVSVQVADFSGAL